MGELGSAGTCGGAVYDALIALAVREHQAELVSLDVRAARTYERLRVRFGLHGSMSERSAGYCWRRSAG